MVVCVSTGVIDRATYLLSRAPAKASDVQIKNIAKGTTDPGVDYLYQTTIREMTTNFNVSCYIDIGLVVSEAFHTTFR